MKKLRFVLGFILASCLIPLASSVANAAPQITDITPNLTTIPKYGKFELSFQIINSSATNHFFPYDPNPPPGISGQSGINVNARFTPDNWQTVYSVPGFYYQPYQNQVKDGQDWIYPSGQPLWKIRFAPNVTGTWQYQIIAVDSSGQSQSSSGQFTVIDSSNHGFIRTSKTDSRYFEYDDGTYFPALGYNLNFNQLDWQNPIQSNQNNLRIMGQNGINFIRIWLSQWKIYGSVWRGWNYTGNGEGAYLTTSPAYPGSDVSNFISTAEGPCISSAQWLQAPIGLKRDTVYRVKARVKTTNLSGPRETGKPYGFVVKTGQLSWMGNTCDNPDLGTRMTTSLTQNSDWTTVEGTYNSGSNDYLEGIYLTLENLTTGTAYIDRVWMEENLGDWGSQTNLIVQPWAATHFTPDQRMSYAFDLALTLAEQNGITLRPVLLDHNDWIFNRIDFNGSITPNASNDNFYGNWRNITKVRWLQQAWWRYVQARWGYSTSIHSWENQNEGDPWNGLHYTMLDELGKYMHCGVFDQPIQNTNGWKCTYRHPNSHLVSDSNWHSYPVNNMWANANYPNLDFADYHGYYHEGSNYDIYSDRNTYSLSSGNFYDTALAYKAISDVLNPKGPESAGKPVVLGEMSFWSDDHAASAFTADTQAVWLHNFIWAHIVPSALISSYWDAQSWYGHIVCQNCAFNTTYDHRSIIGNYYRFIKDIPLSNGNYIDTAATSTHPSLRAWGQKDTINNRAHLWIANSQHTWKNIVDKVTITPITATVTVSGFTTTSPLKVEWWNPYTGTPISTTSATPQNGSLTLTVNNLTTDTAVKIGDYASVGPSPTPTPPGDYDGDGNVDWLDFSYLVKYFSHPYTLFDINRLIRAL